MFGRNKDFVVKVTMSTEDIWEGRFSTKKEFDLFLDEYLNSPATTVKIDFKNTKVFLNKDHIVYIQVDIPV